MSKGKRAAARADPAGPTPERLAHGLIERAPHAIADEAGRPARPYRAVDTLGLMLRKNTITASMRQAGDDFHALFVIAQLDPLRAPDLRRVPQGVHELPFALRQEEARKRIWRSLQALGGIGSPAGSCVWHVVGCAWSLKEWALRAGWGGRGISQEAASGVLVGALGVLEAQYGLR
ncbi:MAG TPA: hypothetical protein VN832_01450 [Stellaceae bacterium]|nr:hypothetical protein [Stellaceae bacterium]